MSTRMGSIYREEMLSLMELKAKGGKVLDVGCHDGLFLQKLDAPTKIGIDPQPIRGKSRINLVQGDGCFLPFGDGTFDYVYALDVIEHIVDDARFADSLVRVLSPGGRLLVTTPSKDIGVFPSFSMRVVNKKWGHTLRPGYSIEELKRLFNQMNISREFSEWNAPYYRTFYFPVRALFAVIPNTMKSVIRTMARKDYKRRAGKHGFLILQAQRSV